MKQEASEAHLHRCPLAVPCAAWSDLDAGSVRNAWGKPAWEELTSTRQALTVESSISRRSHQVPITRTFRGEQDPPGTHAERAPSSWCSRLSGSGVARIWGAQASVARAGRVAGGNRQLRAKPVPLSRTGGPVEA